MVTRYKNPWYKTSGPEFYETTSVPVEYKGFLIYERLDTDYKYPTVDLVKNGICLLQLKNDDRVKEFIDGILGD